MNAEIWKLNQTDLSKGQRTQLRIIESAILLFGTKGLNSVTLQEIAKASKTSHPLILSHFGNKETLLKHVRSYVSFSNHSWVDSKISETDNAYQSLLKHCYENLHWAFKNRNQGKIILLTYYFESLSGVDKNVGLQAMNLGTKRILKYVLQAQREGLINSDHSPELLANIIHEYTVGLYTKLLTTVPENTKVLPKQYKEKFALFLDLHFDS